MPIGALGEHWDWKDVNLRASMLLDRTQTLILSFEGLGLLAWTATAVHSKNGQGFVLGIHHDEGWMVLIQA